MTARSLGFNRMALRTLIFCLKQVGALSLIIGVASFIVSLVGFFVQLLQEVDATRALSFVAFMFGWMFFVGLIGASILALLRLSARAKRAGVSLNYLSGLSKDERLIFQKKHGI
jgi:hypothetical protein